MVHAPQAPAPSTVAGQSLLLVVTGDSLLTLTGAGSCVARDKASSATVTIHLYVLAGVRLHYFLLP